MCDIRKPVLTPYMRRDSELNPEYLDPEHALNRFAPLIGALVRKIRSWGIVRCDQDGEDLKSFIEAEFLRLLELYDPAYGVDFPGYITARLERHVVYHVARVRKKTSPEILSVASDVPASYIESVLDEKAEKNLDLVEQRASVDIEAIEDERCRQIARDILVSRLDMAALARKWGVSERSMMIMVDQAGKHIRGQMERDAFEEEA